MDWIAKLTGILAVGQGARLGEAAVVSRRVHLMDPGRPGIISVLSHADAGRAFYGRTIENEIIHLDLFHQVGALEHRAVAQAVVRVCAEAGQRELSHGFDLQTGTGGGRVTGTLEYGQRPGLLMSHRNHIHLAGLLPGAKFGLLVPLVAALEEQAAAGGLEIRRVEGLRHPPAAGGSRLDLSDYTDYTDSILRGTEAAADSPGRFDPLADEARLQTALNLARSLGGPDEAKRVLDTLRAGGPGGGWLLGGGSQTPFVLRELEGAGLAHRDGRGFKLTEAGRQLAVFLDRHLREVKLRFRKLIRRVPRLDYSGRSPVQEGPPGPTRRGPGRRAIPLAPGGWAGTLAVPETVVAALRRLHDRSTGAQITAAAGPHPLRLQRSDLHVQARSGAQPLYVCLLIDASASMAGQRILAAKHLARHLLVSTKDRISVIAFQERDVRVHIPFTRDYGAVDLGLARIQPVGLTPLAHGLVAGLELVLAAKVRRPLLLLITDGIPTVPKWTVDPLADALTAARRVAESRVPFGCIGLMPSRRYLEELSRAARGTLHVVDELHEDALVAIAHRERKRQLIRH